MFCLHIYDTSRRFRVRHKRWRRVEGRSSVTVAHFFLLARIYTMIAGFYFDPWHGGCLRRIVHLRGYTYRIYGVYGNERKTQVLLRDYDPEPSFMTDRPWDATLHVLKKQGHFYHLSVNFTGKRGKKRVLYSARYDAERRVIEWDDTNMWRQMYYNDTQLFPSPRVE